LSRAPLDRAVAAEMQASEALHRIAKDARPGR
jgi:hypothetical protein